MSAVSGLYSYVYVYVVRQEDEVVVVLRACETASHTDERKQIAGV